MPKLKLPDVTLVAIETREYELQRLAIKDCLDVAQFGDVLLFTDNPIKFFTFEEQIASVLPPHPRTIGGQAVRTVILPDASDKLGWCRQSWYDVPQHVHTSHILQIQWDSWICDAAMWRDEFLDYDYIGAPWWYKDGKNVGNSGFSLISTALKRYLADRRWDFPCDVTSEDDLMCRKYRAQLEDAGFRWAPEWMAHNFAFECCRPHPQSRHFGFHALMNWPDVLEHDRLLDRVRLAMDSPYIGDSYMMQALAQKAPGLITQLKTSSQPDTTLSTGDF